MQIEGVKLVLHVESVTKTKEDIKMKKLLQFQFFDWEAFAAEKDFEVVAVTTWKDFNDKEKVLGTAVEVVIIRDETAYRCKPGEIVTNRHEKFSFKVPKNAVNVSVGDFVVPLNPVATVFGKYNHQLSVRADDVIVVSN